MEAIQYLIEHHKMLGVSLMDIITLALGSFLFIKGRQQQQEIDSFKDMLYGQDGLKPQLEQDIDLKILTHQKACSEKNSEEFARKSEIALIQDGIDTLANSLTQYRNETFQSLQSIQNTLIVIARNNK